MAFIKRATTAGTEGKAYLWMAADYGQGMKRWHYVTTDTPATVEVSGYLRDDEIDGGVGNQAGGVSLGAMQPGDELVVFQVGSLDDTRPIQDDIRAQFVDLSRHYVVASDGGGVNVTPDLESAVITYTS